ncbi:MAG: helix-turn-helix domain-containing protein [Nakamurella sp.]
MSDTVKRQYRSARRASTAAATRSRIREAAALQFIEKGYVATTMRGVAAAAGIGERTLYDAFPTKASLFSHTLGVATVGDEQPVPVADRPEVVRTQHAGTPAESLTDLIVYSTDLLERAGDLIMVSIQATGADPDMKAAADAGARATHQVYLTATQALQQRGALRAGVDAQMAADVMFALCSPQSHHVLRRVRGWTATKYRSWLAETLAEQLLR